MSTVPGQMFDHALDFLKGWPREKAVDFSAKLSANVDATSLPVYGGQVAHVNDEGEFELGAKQAMMPVFLIQGSTDKDVANPNDPANPSWYSVIPSGTMSGLVAIGAYELQSTEYDTSATYHVNDPLHAPTADQITGADKSKAGVLYNKRNWPGGNAAAITVYTDHVCGVVSRMPGLNANRRSVISFWPVYVPAVNG